MNANLWRRLLTLTRYPKAVGDLRSSIAMLARKLCTSKCDHVEPLMACRLIPAKKQPDGIRPIGIGEVLRRIIARCVMEVTQNDVLKAAGNLQTCAGHKAGAEAAVHAMNKIYRSHECDGVLLVDASNAFNTINRKAMLHNIGIICPEISKYVENSYQTPARLISTDGRELRSEEGTTQGDPLQWPHMPWDRLYCRGK